ncbi:MAG: CBS domain-containing protein [Thermoproteota archaeon]|nr:CBS domain-containing protein [Thermoproteota archaeon]
MHESNIGSVIIEKKNDNNNIKSVRIITERDVVRLLGSLNPSLLQTPLRDIMSKPLITISTNGSVKDAIQLMQQKNIRRLVISDSGRMVGIITDKDVFRSIMNNQEIIPSLLGDKQLIQPKTPYDPFGQIGYFAEAISKRRAVVLVKKQLMIKMGR